MKNLTYLVILILSLNSCGSTKYEDNERLNSYLIQDQRIEIQQAFDTLQTLFEIPNSYRVLDIYSEQIDSIERYIPEIPKEVFFYYTVADAETRYCTKFYVDQGKVETIYHMKTKTEIEEIDMIQDKIMDATKKSIEEIEEVSKSL